MHGDLVDFICARAQMKGFEKLVCTDEHFSNLEKMMKNMSFFIELGGIRKMLICAQLLFFRLLGLFFEDSLWVSKVLKTLEFQRFWDFWAYFSRMASFYSVYYSFYY